MVHTDGYHWMKYGQKVLRALHFTLMYFTFELTILLWSQILKAKGGLSNATQKNYYRCSYSCCDAKKFVERTLVDEPEKQSEVQPVTCSQRLHNDSAKCIRVATLMFSVGR